MSYVNDPSELALLPEKISVVEEEEPRDYHEFFYDDIPAEGGRYAGSPEMLYTEVTCHFNELGEHIYMSPKCPHFDMEDEEGRRVNPSWTVQSGNR